MGGPPGALIGLSVGLTAGTAVGAIYGFFAGGYGAYGGDAFEGAPDTSELNEYRIKIR